LRPGVEEGLGVVHVVGGDAVVGPGGDDDGVLALLVDDDHGHPGGGVRGGDDASAVDALALHADQQPLAEVVLADPPEEHAAGALACDGDGLVGALPAGGGGEARPQHRLARGGHVRGADDQVHVDRPDDEDRWLFAHVATFPLRETCFGPADG